QPPTRRDPIRLVAETLRKHFSQVLNCHCAQQLSVDSRDTVRAMRAHDGKVGHSNFAFGTLFYKAYALTTSLILGKASSDVINKAAIYFVNNLHMRRQDPRKANDWPFLGGSRK